MRPWYNTRIFDVISKLISNSLLEKKGLLFLVIFNTRTPSTNVFALGRLAPEQFRFYDDKRS